MNLREYFSIFSNTRKITKEYVTKADVSGMREEFKNFPNVSIKTRPCGKGILERMHADIIITGTVAEQLRTVKAIWGMYEHRIQ